jgi:basic membrane protein A
MPGIYAIFSHLVKRIRMKIAPVHANLSTPWLGGTKGVRGLSGHQPESRDDTETRLPPAVPGDTQSRRMEGNLQKRVTSAALAAVIAAAAFGGMTAPAAAFTACQATDTGGVDDKSFNQTAWKGAQEAQAALGIEVKLLEAEAETDYVPNINSFIEQNCDIIITVGFLLGEATKAAAEANPDQKFSIVDYAYDPVIPNVLGQVYATDEAAFLAGYLAAGVSKTGVVGTFGGINIPTVTIFMDGFYHGVQYYNAQKGTEVQVLGWDPATKEGLFTNNFSNLDDGRAFAKNLNDEGADIVLPVAGPVGLGSAALASELGADALKIIGVDVDQYITDPENGPVYLTSVEKGMDTTVQAAITAAYDGSFEGGVVVGTLANDGVSIAPFHDLDSAVSAELKAELETIKAGIIDGSISVKGS